MKKIEFQAWYILNVWPMVQELKQDTPWYEEHPSYKNAMAKLKFEDDEKQDK